ncbi:MAG TPA: hypothetical protein VFV33_26270 [Gemmatimonadaceae bacterium]|nr:hypothetical protein [Gemmatimonadaceae bacterium]
MYDTIGGPFGPESPNEPSYADLLAEIEQVEAEYLAAIEAEGPAWPDDATLDAWSREAAPGLDVVEVDDPWTCAGPAVLCGMSIGEWMVWLPEIGRIVDASIDDMFAAALAALEE